MSEIELPATHVDDDVIRKLVTEELRTYFAPAGPSNDGIDMSRIERIAAACDSITYLNARAPTCPRYNSGRDLLDAGMANRIIDGLILEFGVYSGGTLNHIASLTDNVVYGFDSFEGLPEEWRPGFEQGAFRRSSLPDVRENVELVVGWFDNTLPNFVAAHSQPIALLHVDCDLYSSTKTIFYFLSKQIVSGTVIVFDEYLNYVGWRLHEYKAFQEFISSSGLGYRYIGAVLSHQQIAVQIL